MSPCVWLGRFVLLCFKSLTAVGIQCETPSSTTRICCIKNAAFIKINCPICFDVSLDRNVFHSDITSLSLHLFSSVFQNLLHAIHCEIKEAVTNNYNKSQMPLCFSQGSVCWCMFCFLFCMWHQLSWITESGINYAHVCQCTTTKLTEYLIDKSSDCYSNMNILFSEHWRLTSVFNHNLCCSDWALTNKVR